MRSFSGFIVLGIMLFTGCSGQQMLNGERPEDLPYVPPQISSPQVAPPRSVKSAPVKPIMPGAKFSRISVPQRVVALTFDDGPHGVYTPRILDTLAKYNAKCTFFMLGQNVTLHPAIAKRIVTEGHEAASHTWNHPQLTRLSMDGVKSQMDRTQAAIVNACGVTPKLMRPPYGAVNSSITSTLNSCYGYSVVLWDVDTNDWRKPGASTIVSRAVNGAKPGSIILVHDIHGMTEEAVEGIVKGLTERGFKLVTVSQLVRMGKAYAGGVPSGAPMAPDMETANLSWGVDSEDKTSSDANDPVLNAPFFSLMGLPVETSEEELEIVP